MKIWLFGVRLVTFNFDSIDIAYSMLYCVVLTRKKVVKNAESFVFKIPARFLSTYRLYIDYI